MQINKLLYKFIKDLIEEATRLFAATPVEYNYLWLKNEIHELPEYIEGDDIIKTYKRCSKTQLIKIIKVLQTVNKND